MSRNDTIEIENVRCYNETPDAILAKIDGEEHWIPKSQIGEDSEVQGEGDDGVLVVTRWLAEKRSLI